MPGYKCPGCAMPDIPTHRPCCGHCWAALPDELRLAIGAAWANRHEATDAQKATMVATLAWLRARRLERV